MKRIYKALVSVGIITLSAAAAMSLRHFKDFSRKRHADKSEDVQDKTESAVENEPRSVVDDESEPDDADGMNLSQYDGKCVRVILVDGNIIDGICSYNGSEYNEHEFGCAEEGIQFPNLLLYKSDIESIESLEEHTGPYGRFLDPYGRLEEMAVEDGIDMILEVLWCEEKEHVMRMLNCLDKYMDPSYGYEFPCRNETIGALMELVDSTDDEDIKEEAQRLIDLWQA